jgi:hypothetical protein
MSRAENNMDNGPRVVATRSEPLGSGV